jgi:hypothetical protein
MPSNYKDLIFKNPSASFNLAKRNSLQYKLLMNTYAVINGQFFKI